MLLLMMMMPHPRHCIRKFLWIERSRCHYTPKTNITDVHNNAKKKSGKMRKTLKSMGSAS
jgi:hypothetical protein